MRLVKDILHERYKIQILNYNSKYIIKVELGQFEQLYKIGETDVNSLQEVENMITAEFLSNCLHRFLSMREDWSKAFTEKNNLK